MGLVDRRPVFPSIHGVSGPETGCMPQPSHGVLGTTVEVAYTANIGVTRRPRWSQVWASAARSQLRGQRRPPRLPQCWPCQCFCTERRFLWLARLGRKALARQAFFREGREPKTKFNRGLSTAARCCPPLPYLNETWQPRYRQTQSRGLCLTPEGCTVVVSGLEHDSLSTGGGLGEGFICRSDW